MAAEFASLLFHQFDSERHGKYLVSSPKLAVKIEGNTDERDGAEYKLAPTQ